MIKTKTGWAEMVGKEWRDGQFPQASGGVARLTVHDDVTNAVWKYTGKKRDAAEAIGALYVRDMGDDCARLYGDHIEIETRPEDLMIGKGEPDEDGNYDDYALNVEKYPDVVAY